VLAKQLTVGGGPNPNAAVPPAGVEFAAVRRELTVIDPPFTTLHFPPERLGRQASHFPQLDGAVVRNRRKRTAIRRERQRGNRLRVWPKGNHFAISDVSRARAVFSVTRFAGNRFMPLRPKKWPTEYSGSDRTGVK